MKCYKVSCEANVESNDGVGACMSIQTVSKFAGTQADVRSTRQTFVNDHGVKKKDVKVEQTDIPMDKSGLLDFINSLVVGE